MSYYTKSLVPSLSFCTLTTDNVTGLGAAISLPLLLGYLANCQTHRFKMLYYCDVIKPSFIPPDRAAVVPIWTILSIAVGFSSYLVYHTGRIKGLSVIRPLMWYGAQLAVNLCWPSLFFRYRNIKIALYNAIVNHLLALVTAYRLSQIDMEAGQLMVPYLIWMTLVVYANLDLWLKNRDNILLINWRLFERPSDRLIAKASLQLAVEQYHRHRKELLSYRKRNIPKNRSVAT